MGFGIRIPNSVANINLERPSSMPYRTLTGSLLSRIKHYPGERLGRVRIPEHTFMVVVAVVIGIFGGFGAILFRLAIRVFQRVVTDT